MSFFIIAEKLSKCNWNNYKIASIFLLKLTKNLQSKGENNFSNLSSDKIIFLQSQVKRLYSGVAESGDFTLFGKTLINIPLSFELYRYTGDCTQEHLVSLYNAFTDLKYTSVRFLICCSYLIKYSDSKNNKEAIENDIRYCITHYRWRKILLPFIMSWNHKKIDCV